MKEEAPGTALARTASDNTRAAGIPVVRRRVTVRRREAAQKVVNPLGTRGTARRVAGSPAVQRRTAVTSRVARSATQRLAMTAPRSTKAASSAHQERPQAKVGRAAMTAARAPRMPRVGVKTARSKRRQLSSAQQSLQPKVKEAGAWSPLSTVSFARSPSKSATQKRRGCRSTSLAAELGLLLLGEGLQRDAAIFAA